MSLTNRAKTTPRGRSREDLEAGASLVEYALLLALITVVALGAVQAMGRNAADDSIRSACHVSHPSSSPDRVTCCTAQGHTTPAACG